MFHKRSSVINLIYSGQLKFSHISNVWNGQKEHHILDANAGKQLS
jgi:hypothetical protein